MSQEFIKTYLEEVAEIAGKLDVHSIEKLADLLHRLRSNNGRLFILGVGGGAGNASHAVNDFRKIARIEAYAPTDNVSELTARINDEGWSSVFVAWLKTSKLTSQDMLLVFSVGGGDVEKNVSPNLVTALQYGKEVGCKIGGIVGPKGGFTAEVADACVLVPEASPDRITPHSESFQAVVWHLLVSDPRLKANQTKWESINK
jgi:D-sedoheptulose 7-phosphate isomerase